MVLRDRRRGAAAQPAAGARTLAGFTVGDVGRSLRRARIRQGLSVKDVSMRTGLPSAHLRAAETGALDVPDQLATLKTVRRYADFLGLPGDRYALALLEHWPTSPGQLSRTYPQSAEPATTSTPPATPAATVASSAAPGTPAAINGARAGGTERAGRAKGAAAGHAAANGPPTVTLPAASPADRDAPEPAAVNGSAGAPVMTAVPVLGGQRGTTDAASAALGSAFHDTGITPAVRAPADRQVMRPSRQRVPVLLQRLVWASGIAVLAGIVAVVVDRLDPNLFGTGGTARPSAAAAGHAPTPASTATTTHTTALAHTPLHGTHASKGAAATATIQPTSTSATTATLDVGTSPFVVHVSAVGGICWLYVTSPTSSAPLYNAVIQPGESESFTAEHSLTVEVGSSAGRFSVTASSKTLLSTYEPPTDPYTITFQASTG